MKGRRRPIKDGGGPSPLHSPTTQGAAFSHLQPFRERQASWSLPSSSTLVIVSVSLSHQKGNALATRGQHSPTSGSRGPPSFKLQFEVSS